MEDMPERSQEKWTVPFKRVVDQLLHAPSEDVVNSARSFRIEGPIDPDNLRKLCELPYELLITRDEQGLLMTTGNKDTTVHAWDKATRRRLQNAHSTLHNHPPFAGPNADTPSIGDMLFFLSQAYEEKFSKNIIIHSDGVVSFGFGSSSSLALFNERCAEIQRKHNLSDKEFYGDETSPATMVRVYPAWRELAETLGIISGRATWDEPKNVHELLRDLNE
ncbi:MAG: hypothetical protein RLZZ416_706 [Candidatus Parcubacteria bacterium]|jgi:hypothetical protein